MPPFAAPALVGPALVCLGVGGFVFGRGLARWRRTRVTPAWRETTASIVRAEIFQPNRAPSRYTMHPVPAVRFAYHVDGATYEGWFEHTRVEYDDRDAAAQVAARFPVGQPLRVRYDPRAPGHAVAEGDYPWRGYGSITVGAVLLALGAWLAARALGAI